MKKIIIFLIIISFFSLFFVKQPALSGLDEEKKKLEQYKTELEKVKSTIKEITTSSQEITSLINGLDGEINIVTGNINYAENKISALENEISQKETQIKSRENEINLREGELEELLNLSYKLSQVSTMELLYEGSEPAIVQQRISYISYISSYSNSLMGQAQKDRQELLVEKNNLQKSKNDLTNFLNQKIQEQSILKDEVEIKSSLLKSLQEKKTYYLYQKSEIEEEIKKEDALIKKLIEEAMKSQLTLKTGLIWPIKGEITSGFGWRTSPIWGGKEFHEGIDIAVNTGTPVKAAADGEIIYVDWMTGYGNLVIISHGSDVSTFYAHLKSFTIKKGEMVKQGQTIAYSDNTGWSTGPHLHFGVYIGNKAINPLDYLPKNP